MFAIVRRFQLASYRWLVRTFAGNMDAADFEPAPSLFSRVKGALLGLVADKDKVNSVMMGPVSFQIVRCGIRLGVFELLNKKPGLSNQEIADALSLDPYPTELLLLGLIPLGFVHRVKDRFYADPFLSRVLLHDVNNGLLPKHFEYLHYVLGPAVQYLEESMLQRKPVGLHKTLGAHDDFYHALAVHPEKGRFFERYMQTITSVNRDRVAGLPLFSEFNRVLDVGGHIGEMALAIMNHHARTQVTLFDFPELADKARARFAEEGLTDRSQAVGGNIIRDDFPPGCDCVLFSHVVDIFSPERNRGFLRRAFQSLPAGGGVCVLSPVVADDESGPYVNAVASPYFLCLANGEGRFYSAKTIAGWMRDEGFESVQTIRLPINEAVLVGRKPSSM